MTTAAGVAVGHTVGRMITGLFPGSSGVANAVGDVAPSDAAVAQQERCAPDVKRFVECMRERHEDLSACQQYYDMMAACARQVA